MSYFLWLCLQTGCEEMKKLFKNKKAVSPVIATVLMILVTMAGMTILFAFVASYSENYKAGLGGSVMESLTIEDVSVSGIEVKVWVYNAATKANLGTDVDFKVAAIYVDGVALINTRGSSIPGSPDYNPNHDTINFNDWPAVKAGMHMAFTGDALNSIGNGRHDITIATQRGSNFKDQFDKP
jgi:flagellin-like protein